MRMERDASEEYYYRLSGVIIIIFWSTEHKLNVFTYSFSSFSKKEKKIFRSSGKSWKKGDMNRTSIERNLMKFQFLARMEDVFYLCL